MLMLSRVYCSVVSWLDRVSSAFPPLALRILLDWAFGESGDAKLTGSNWFAELSFPFPFDLLPPAWSWQMATWFELVGALALVVGLATRFVSISLIVLTIVAIAAVHWPAEWNSLAELLRGYRILDEAGDGFGNYKLPVIYLVMFLPLLFGGAGRWSVDAWLKARLGQA